MFKNWGFLLGEIWLLLLLAALLGLFAGWLIWGRRSTVEISGNGDAAAEAERLKRELSACQKAGADHAAKVSALEAQLKASDARADRLAADAGAGMTMAAPAAAVAAAPAAVSSGDVADAGAAAPAQRPAALSAAREGGPDDLKLIKGIGPKMEKLCNSLGFYHFDQIANWTAAEVAWVDDNLEGFKGRVTRDEWVVQARDLAAGKPPRAMADIPDFKKS